MSFLFNDHKGIHRSFVLFWPLNMQLAFRISFKGNTLRIIFILFALFLCFANPVIVQYAIADSKVDEPAIGWGKKLNIKGEMPATGFKAIYIDRNKPDVIAFEEPVSSIAIDYAYNEFHQIDSPNFGAYWVGKLNFNKNVTKQIDISQSWAHSRIIIDGKLIFDKADRSASLFYDFSAGEHVIEVEHYNNWHTVQFKVAVTDVVSFTTEAAITAYFQQNKLDVAEVYYVSVHKSSAPDSTIHVVLPETKKPAVLWLDSYSPVDWILEGPSDGIYAVALSSFSTGARVTGKKIDHRFDLKSWVGVANETMRCSCMSGYFLCEDKRDLLSVARGLRDVTGNELTAYAVNYSADKLAITPYDKNVVEQIRQQRVKNAEMQNLCKNNADEN
jgi:hypothetical protein